MSLLSAMVRDPASQRQKQITEAEGYLALAMPAHALASLAAIEDSGDSEFNVEYLRGESLRALERHQEALDHLERASALQADHVGLLMALAWCYKRTGQLPKAITATERAYRAEPKEAVLLYNLACYWSLAGNKTQALSWLGRALRMEKSLRKLIDDEPDFDPLRADADFQMILRAVDAAGAP
jgi:tetratricopeptide (TPR) repeat protein